MRPTVRILLSAALATAAFAATACSTQPTDSAGPPLATSTPPATTAVDPSPSASPTTARAPIGAATGPHNDIDEMFARDMIPHHRQAVEMAALATTRAADPRVKQIAAAIRTAQEPEIKAMSAWLRGWGEQIPPPDKAHTAHGPGMMTHADMVELEAAKGAAFDRLFCTMMIRHHQGALEMAGATTTRGANSAVRQLTVDIVKTQRAEITQLRDILRSL